MNRNVMCWLLHRAALAYRLNRRLKGSFWKEWVDYIGAKSLDRTSGEIGYESASAFSTAFRKRRNASENLASLHKKGAPRSDHAGHGARSLARGRDHADWLDP